jgi:hypothetical protein
MYRIMTNRMSRTQMSDSECSSFFHAILQCFHFKVMQKWADTDELSLIQKGSEYNFDATRAIPIFKVALQSLRDTCSLSDFKYELLCKKTAINGALNFWIASPCGVGRVSNSDILCASTWRERTLLLNQLTMEAWDERRRRQFVETLFSLCLASFSYRATKRGNAREIKKGFEMKWPHARSAGVKPWAKQLYALGVADLQS